MTEDVKDRALTVPDRATALTVASPADYEAAGKFLTIIKSLRAEIADTFNPIIIKAHAAHKEALAQRARYDDPLNAGERTIKSKMGAYYSEQERIRRAEQLRLEEEAKRAAEDAMIKEAALAESLGDKGAAEAILDEEIILAPVVAPPAVQKQTGISVRENWGFEVFDLKALVAAVVAGGVPASAIEANEKFLGQQARSLKAELRYPGVRVTCQKIIGAAAAK